MSNVTNLKGFFNPDLDKSMSGHSLRKRRKKKPTRARFENVRTKVLMRLGLHDKSTDIGICFCIHKETGWDMPGKVGQYRSYIAKYYRKIRNQKTYRKASKDDTFYGSKRWKELRFVALRMSEGTCELCGARASDGVQLQVDHIKPRSKFPEFQWDLENLQILCEDCNYGKSNYDDTDYRSW